MKFRACLRMFSRAKIVAALPKKLLEKHALSVANQISRIRDIGSREILGENRPVICDIGSLLHFGSVGSLEYVPETTPTELSTPAGTIVPAVEPEAKLMTVIGFQPISLDRRMACAANLPVPAMKRASAWALLKLTIWDSIVGSDNS